MTKDLDCIVCGSCVVDVLVRPVPLETPITGGKLFETEPLELTTGGIVSNSGITMARLGMRVAAFSYVGDDPWAAVIRNRYEAEGLHAEGLLTHPAGATSTTAVLIDSSGERSFMHCVGAPRLLDREAFFSRFDLFRRSRSMLLGYYPLLPNLLGDLPEVLSALRKEGCLTALDAAGDGGALGPLLPVLPHLDLYVPSLDEAIRQTGQDEPRKIVETYREAGAPGVVGVKLGRRGVLLSPQDDQYIEIPAVAPPGDVVDTTGAGDCFLGGLLTGLLRGMSPAEAGRLGCAAGACCVTCLGATSGIRDYAATAALAGLKGQ
ncbi:MAG: carbohydrate kinase family protein [Pirellulales bacterium]|nr:carbohydrate kinase family protein [Pirellulales bacterium]